MTGPDAPEPREPMAWAAQLPVGHRATGRAADGSTYEGKFRLLRSGAERDAESFLRDERVRARHMQKLRTLRVRDVFPPKER